MGNEAMELIEMLYAMVAEAKKMPLAGDKCLVDREYTLSMLESLRDCLPREMEEARRLWEAKDEFIASAKREAEQIRAAAEEQAHRMIEQEEVMRQARARADEIVTAAVTKQQELFRMANITIDNAASDGEAALSAALNQVRSFRNALRGAVAAQPAAEEDDLSLDDYA